MMAFRAARASAAGAAAILALTCGLSSASADPIVLTPHHATYKLSLTRSVGEKAPAAASGVISYDFTGSACEGYAMVFRQITEMQPPEGDSRMSDMRSATYEDGEGKQFRFNITTTSSQGDQDDLDGRAAKQADGKVDVDLSKPSKAKAEFQAGTLFPTEHLRRIIQTAEAGGKLLTVSVYDGSDTGKKRYDTLTVIGAPITAPANEAAAQIDGLKGVRRWPVTISYFEDGKGDQQPSYVLAFDLYENGVSRALKLDYGDFTLSGELSELKLLPAPSCTK